MKLNNLIIQTISIFILIFNSFEISGQDCSSCQKQLLLKVNEIEKIGKKLDSMENNTKILISQLGNLASTGNISISSTDQIKIEQLKIEKTKLNKKLSESNAALQKANSKVNDQQNSLDKLNKKIDELQEKIKLQNEINSKLQAIIDCVKEFENQSKMSEPEVTLKLEAARNEFNAYKRLLQTKSKDEPKKARIIDSVINTYEGYKGKTKVTDCGGIKLSFFQDYLSVQDYNNIAEIYGRNLGNSISRLDSANQINESNRRVLEAAGVIMEKGNYNDRSDIANKLSKYITKERRPGSANSELISNFKNIITAFDKSSYLEVLTLYDSYEKFITLESMKEHKNLLDEVEYCIGNILLLDLGSYGTSIFNIIQGDWLKDFASIKECGNAKLNLLIQDQNTNIDLRKKATIVKNKYYE